jgi:hypothetical protein
MKTHTPTPAKYLKTYGQTVASCSCGFEVTVPGNKVAQAQGHLSFHLDRHR